MKDPNLNLTIFVVGVILNPAGVTVTNTHWFVVWAVNRESPRRLWRDGAAVTMIVCISRPTRMT